MTLNRAHGPRGPVLFVVGVVAGFALCRCIARDDPRSLKRLDRLGSDLGEHLDEVCARLRDLGQRLGAYPSPSEDGRPGS